MKFAQPQSTRAKSKRKPRRFLKRSSRRWADRSGYREMRWLPRHQHVRPKTVSDKCAFCGSPLGCYERQHFKMHKPEYVLPFRVWSSKKLLDHSRTGFPGFGFAPAIWKVTRKRPKYEWRLHSLLDFRLLDGQQLHRPARWRLLCDRELHHSRERTNCYQTKASNQTRWYSASGNVNNTFDDLLIEGQRLAR